MIIPLEIMLFRRTKHFFANPLRMITKLMMRYCPNLVPDKQYIQYVWEQKMDYPLNLSNPQTFNEKLQWLKLHDHNPLYTTLVDKIAVKQWVANRIGEEFVIPTLAVYDSVEDIDLEKLPNQFVLKCNHDSGSVVICSDKSSFDLEAAKYKLGESMKKNYYWYWREWPYKNVKPQIMVEAYLEDEKSHELLDYKFFCFNGEVKALFIATDRNSTTEETKFDFFDEDFNHLDVTNGHPHSAQEKIPCKPKTFDSMKKLAAKLSLGMRHVRCDFYEIDGKVYFGEMTFYHWSGFVPFEPRDYDYKLGECLEVPSNQKE